MLSLIEVPLLVGIILLLSRTNKVFLCAGIWAVLEMVLTAFVFVHLSFVILVRGAIAFALSLGYFALLDYLKYKKSWWVAMAVGFVVLVSYP